MSPKQRDRLPNPERLEWELDELLTLLLEHRSAIVNGYKASLDLGLAPGPGSDGVNVRSGISNPVPEIAVGDLKHKRKDGTLRPAPGENDRRETASIFSRVELARKAVDSVVIDVNRGRERQQEWTKDHAVITRDEHESLVAALRRREMGV